MLEKEVILRAKDDSGFGSYADTHIIRVKNEDGRKVRNVLHDAGIKVKPYANAGMAFAEDMAEKTLSTLVEKRREEQAVNGCPMSESDMILADEAIYKAREFVGEMFYERICNSMGSFAASMVDEIMDNSHKAMSVDDCVKLGLITPGSLIEKVENESELSVDLEEVLDDEFEKSRDDYMPYRSVIEDETKVDIGKASKKTILT